MDAEIDRWLMPSLERDWESFPKSYCSKNSRTSLLGLFHVIDRSVIDIITWVSEFLQLLLATDLSSSSLAWSKQDEEQYCLQECHAEALISW